MRLDGNRHACTGCAYVTYNALADFPECCPICGGQEFVRTRACFPPELQVVTQYDLARCQSCGGPLAILCASGKPVGEGSKRGTCPKCARDTLFELHGQVVEQGLLQEGAL